MKKVLCIAYHYPPILVSSGLQRTLKFSQYLLDHAWQSVVLTVHPRAYVKVDEGQLPEIPKEVVVHRVSAWDASKHFAIKGRYFYCMALPDRWASWCIPAVIKGLRVIFKDRPSLIYSTYPIATAHLIALMLHRMTKLPWVADFRDPMIQNTVNSFPTDALKRKIFQWLEKETITHCQRAVVTTYGALKEYRERYPQFQLKFELIANGFDEGNFINAQQLEQIPTYLQEKKPGKLVLLHSGVIYLSERNPTEFFQALAELKQQGKIHAESLTIVLRAADNEALFSTMLKRYDIDDIVLLMPSIGYEEALAEMLSVDGLLVLQGMECNNQIPAKLYEYLRAGKPIFALTDMNGDTAGVLVDAGVRDIVSLNDKAAIVTALPDFLQKVTEQRAFVPDKNYISRHSRQNKSALLARVFDDVLEETTQKSKQEHYAPKATETKGVIFNQWK